MGFVERHGLRSDEAAAAALQLVDDAAASTDVIRLSFADVHGVLRGKTITTSQLATALRDGWGFPSSMLLKDTSHRTVFDVFGDDPTAVPDPDFLGIGDRIMIPDPTTFRVLPWAKRTGWMLCDVVRKNGDTSPFCTRSLHRRINAELARKGWSHSIGIEIEFYVFRDNEQGEPKPLNDGYQYLTEQRLDDLEPVLEPIRSGLLALGLPLRSLEVEFGPSQIEVTLVHGDAVRVVDDMILLRSAVKQICRNLGYHATFMCRPKIANAMSSGWHLHQSLADPSGANAFASPDGDLSEVGSGFLAGLLDHAAGATALTNPTINSYRRFQPNSLAPDRIAWGIDNRSSMVRAILDGAPDALRLENRVGDPAANPYLYVAAQVVSGRDGIASSSTPPAAATATYLHDAPELPRSLADALVALEGDDVLRNGFGSSFVDYFVHIKRAELDRFEREVTQWEHDEYFELF